MSCSTNALHLLVKRLEKDEWRDGERLPRLELLAAECNVSRATMWKVIQTLKQRELLHTKRGGYIIAGKGGVAQTALKRKDFAWERLRNTMGNDLSTGKLSATRLPPITKLALHYSVSISTVRKALAALLADSQIDRTGNTYKTRSLNTEKSWQTVVLITLGNRDSGVSIRQNRNREVVEAFERDRVRQGFRPLCIGFEATHPDSILKVVAQVKEYSNIVGFIINPWDFWDPLIRQRWFDLVEILLHYRQPLIVLDHEGDTAFPTAIKRNQYFRCLRIAGHKAGEMVGRFLCDSGYTKVAFVASLPNLSWAHKRFEGIARHAERYGNNRITANIFEPSFTGDQTLRTLVLLRLTEEQIRILYRKKVRSEQLEEMLAHYRRIQQEELNDPADPHMEDYRRILLALSSLADTNHAPESLEEIIGTSMRLADIRSAMLLLRSHLFDQVAAFGADVWVCSDEFVSFAAYHYLREHGYTLPEKISLFGFENWQYTHEYQISAYDFNMTGLVQKALVCIFDARAFKELPTITEVDGYIVNRRTTKRVMGVLDK